MQLRDDLKSVTTMPLSTCHPTLNWAPFTAAMHQCICACCELHMDIRPLPGMTLNDLNGLLDEALAPVSERWPGRLTVSELHRRFQAMNARRTTSWSKWLKTLGAQTEVVNYCTEAPVYPDAVSYAGVVDRAPSTSPPAG